MSEKEEYIERQKKCGIAEGDEVRVLRTAAYEERGWMCSWIPCMDKCVGKVMVVQGFDGGSYGIMLDHQLKYPYYVLEIVKKADGSVPSKVAANTNVSTHCQGCKHIDTDVCLDCIAHNGSCTCHTGNPPCSYCTDSLWEEEEEPKLICKNPGTTCVILGGNSNTSERNSIMSSNGTVLEQTVARVTIIEKTEVLHGSSGILQKINREILFDDLVSAVGSEAQKQVAYDAIRAGMKPEAKLDHDKLEVTCSPF